MTTLTPTPKQQFLDANGNPLAGGKVYTYAAGTTTPLVTYTDESGTTPNTNPVILDSRGEAAIWLGVASYKLKLTTSTDVEIWTVDNIVSASVQALADLSESGGSALVGYLPAGTGAVATTVQAKLREFVSVKDFGAKGDGVTDDGAAIRAAVLAHPKVYFPAGTYVYTGAAAAPNSANMELIGDGPGISIISLGSSVQFFSTSVSANNIHVSKLQFNGGAGAFQWTSTGANVSGIKIFENCYFYNYTRCAVEENHVDSPYWMFNNCVFFAANSTSTMGVALGGDPSNCVFDSCVFLKNRIHIKGQQGLLSTQITNCDFIQFDAGNGTPRAFIWAVPHTSITNSGNGFVVNGCKFGNENQASTDYRILYADEGSGTYNADKFPNLAADSTGYISQHSVINTKIVGATAIPVIYSTTNNVTNVFLENIAIDGTAPSYSIQFRTVTTTFDRSQYKIYAGQFSGEIGTNVVSIPVSNSTVQKTLIDPLGNFEGDSTNQAIYPVLGIGRVGYTELWTARIGSFTLGGGATLTGSVTDGTGGTEAAEFAMNSGLVYAHLAVTPTVGEPAWIHFDLKAAASSSCTIICVRVRLDGNGAIAFQRFINVPSGWRTFRFPLFFKSAVSNYILEFTQATGNTGTNIQIGRARGYHSREPVPIGMATVETLQMSSAATTTVAPGAGGAGALPATPLGYVTIKINGTDRKVAYY
jgi:hypothetical protein